MKHKLKIKFDLVPSILYFWIDKDRWNQFAIKNDWHEHQVNEVSGRCVSATHKLH